MSDDQKFRVRAHRPETRMPGETYPMFLPGTFDEPAEASDVAESWLRAYGKDMQSFCDLLFNGDADPHSSVFRITYTRYGVWNREGVPWPIDYVDAESGMPDKLLDHPHFIALGEDDMPAPKEDDEGKHKAGDENKMKIDGEDDDEPENDSEDDDAEDEEWDDEDGDDAENEPEDDTEGDDDQGEDDDEDDEQGEDDEGEEDDEDDENNGDDDEGDDPGDEGDDEGDSESDDDTENESDQDEEPEMPRLTIFAKMRGPKGWRKRAEIEELNERNVFGFKVGVLDEDGETPGTQEYNVRTEIQFVEQDAERKTGVLRIKLPDGMTPEDFTQLKSGWIIAQVPYYDEGN